jgi:hypothetical protein
MHTSAEFLYRMLEERLIFFLSEHLVQFNPSYDIIIHASQTLARLASPRTEFKFGCNKCLSVIWYLSAQ